MRIGHGYDAHRYGKGIDFILGGVKIPSDFGMTAHSDGDVLCHAVIDSLLGAAGLADIGHQFPDTDAEYKGISSLELLRRTVKMLSENGFEIEYIDCTVVAQAPKIGKYLDLIKQSLAKCVGIESGQINVKATTEENMGFTGSLEGICAHSVCLLTERGR